jgi:hypothetical protein
MSIHLIKGTENLWNFFVAGDREDCSSGDSYEDFAYGVHVDPQDVALYGEGYANYKARMKYQLYSSDECQEDYDQELSSNEEEEEYDDPAGRFT